jgi:hypothetical protein
MTLLRPQFDVGILSPKLELPARSAGPCTVELGRYGDIINILPVLRFGPLWSFCARSFKEFSGILDGVSAKPFVLDCGFADVAARRTAYGVQHRHRHPGLGKNWNAE